MPDRPRAVRVPGTEPPLVDMDRLQQQLEQGTDLLAEANERLQDLAVTRHAEASRQALDKALSRSQRLQDLLNETERAALLLQARAGQPAVAPQRSGWGWALFGLGAVAVAGWAFWRRRSRRSPAKTSTRRR